MKRRYRSPRTAPLIVVLITTVAAVTLALCVVTFLRSYRAAAEQSARTSSAQAVNQVVGTVSNYVENLDETVSGIMVQMNTPEEERDAYLNAWLTARSEVVAVTTYDENGVLQDCWCLGHTPREEIVQNLSFDLSTAQSHGEGYISAPHVESIFEGYYPWVVTVVRPMESGDTVHWVAVDVRFSGLGASINGVGIGQHGYCYLMDAQGNMVYHPQQQLLYAGIKSEEAARLASLKDGTYVEDTVIYSIQGVPDSSWRVVGVSYIDETVNQSFWQMARITMGTAAMILVAALLVGWIISRMLSRPLQQLENAMEQFEQDADEFNFQPVAGTREVQELSDSFGHMVRRIQRLMTTVREEENELRKTELKALQAQINPHFLYNTLNAISWQAADQGETQISVLATSLGRFFRISLNRGQEVVEVEEEMEQVRSYLRIQKIRYQDLLDYDFAVEDEVRHQKMIKLVVQPLVENAIYHGLKPLGRPGHIYIRAQLRKGGPEGPMIWITVEDDGAGIPAEKLAVLNETLAAGQADPDKGYGIFNVNERIKLYYGNTYGLMLESLPGQGTRATLNFPSWIVEEPDDEAGV